MADYSVLFGNSFYSLSSYEQRLICHVEAYSSFEPAPNPRLLVPGDLVVIGHHGIYRSGVITQINSRNARVLTTTPHAITLALNTHKHDLDIDPVIATKQWLASLLLLQDLNVAGVQRLSPTQEREMYQAKLKSLRALKDKARTGPAAYFKCSNRLVNLSALGQFNPSFSLTH